MAGASVAAFLAAHVRVAVVEREALAGMHTTGRSAAMFMESYGPAQVRALTRASRHYLEQGAGWLSPRSALFIARASQAQALAELKAQLHADGVGTGSLQHLTTAQAQQAALTPDDLQILALIDRFGATLEAALCEGAAWPADWQGSAVSARLNCSVRSVARRNMVLAKLTPWAPTTQLVRRTRWQGVLCINASSPSLLLRP